MRYIVQTAEARLKQGNRPGAFVRAAAFVGLVVCIAAASAAIATHGLALFGSADFQSRCGPFGLVVEAARNPADVPDEWLFVLSTDASVSVTEDGSPCLFTPIVEVWPGFGDEQRGFRAWSVLGFGLSISPLEFAPGGLPGEFDADAHLFLGGSWQGPLHGVFVPS